MSLAPALPDDFVALSVIDSPPTTFEPSQRQERFPIAGAGNAGRTGARGPTIALRSCGRWLPPSSAPRNAMRCSRTEQRSAQLFAASDEETSARSVVVRSVASVTSSEHVF